MNTWWFLEYQDVLPTWNALTVQAATTSPQHLFMAWSYHQPAKQPVYREVRGKRILCGFTYIWNTPRIQEQTEYGDTTTHTMPIINLTPRSTIWFYLYTPWGPYYRQCQGPLTHVTLPELSFWVQRAYAATNRYGVYFTDNLTVNKGSPAGVPTWTQTNNGLPENINFLAFTCDPFNPSFRQYFLDWTALYRRTGNPWQPVLTRKQILQYTGANDVAASRFPNAGLATNNNQPGYVATTFVAQHTVRDATQYRNYFCLSSNYGATWTIITAEDGTLNLPWPAGLSWGYRQGASPYPPGRVIYSMARKANQAYSLQSIDGGYTWTATLIGTAVPQDPYTAYEGTILVDPNQQNIVYFTGCIDATENYRIKRSTDHGQTWSYYDDNADAPLGGRVSYHLINKSSDARLRVGTERVRLDLYRTINDGVTWQHNSTPVHSPSLSITTVPDAGASLYILGTFYDHEMNYHLLWCSSDEGQTLYPKSGRHPQIPVTGGGDSIPYDSEGIRGFYPILT